MNRTGTIIRLRVLIRNTKKALVALEKELQGIIDEEVASHDK